jgi:serine/threonine protein phosphatase PrpC
MLIAASVSEKGGRTINEDFVGLITDECTGFFVLADGLGGHGRGEVASQFVVEQSMKHHSEFPGDLEGCFLESQNLLLNEQRRLNAVDEMKTTMTCLWIAGGTAKWGHVGDSRLYYFKDRKMNLRTLDHSVPQMLVSIGEIREKDIRGHEDRNRLLRVMGMEWDSPKYELSSEIFLTGHSAFLLSSDGFWELITEHEMEKALKRAKSPSDWLETMKNKVLKNGKGKNMDNLSAIAVFVE